MKMLLIKDKIARDLTIYEICLIYFHLVKYNAYNTIIIYITTYVKIIV